MKEHARLRPKARRIRRRCRVEPGSWVWDGRAADSAFAVPGRMAWPAGPCQHRANVGRSRYHCKALSPRGRCLTSLPAHHSGPTTASTPFVNQCTYRARGKSTKKWAATVGLKRRTTEDTENTEDTKQNSILLRRVSDKGTCPVILSKNRQRDSPTEVAQPKKSARPAKPQQPPRRPLHPL